MFDLLWSDSAPPKKSQSNSRLALLGAPYKWGYEANCKPLHKTTTTCTKYHVTWHIFTTITSFGTWWYQFHGVMRIVQCAIGTRNCETTVYGVHQTLLTRPVTHHIKWRGGSSWLCETRSIWNAISNRNDVLIADPNKLIQAPNKIISDPNDTLISLPDKIILDPTSERPYFGPK